MEQASLPASIYIPPFPDGGYDLQEFLSLEDAISGIENWGNNNIFREMNAFPLFGIKGAVYWTVGFQEEKDFAPIYSNDEAEFPASPDYPSLFAMVEKNFERLRRFDK
ncbi:hypothetical protein DSM106972_032190 [Dulcicalothrix desertica PCC 7102]|uniref:Uncharacterized protein n=1 Tax=Dulcicalothrix desertica PCC 7102 TaxID=232991 RepID=A0A3S1B6Q8_9CYAN|nr:hypothetical protein [Dulcicalothrix desertica]RUT06013.1 hypothetical protein DSM106972_032190 [Dulcicalothrix desertica PCC 7102]TWH54321.1 hypothetical protein CAL7102_02340 [Dulcicalothrix desertica PCC 7102]